MQAKNGSGLRGRGSSRRIAVFVFALAALTAMLVPSIASARRGTEVETTKNYLAMGDSLAFGYSQQVFIEQKSKGDPASAFEKGYASDYWKLLGSSKAGIGLINNGCPGETSESLIGNNPTLLATLNFVGAKNGIPTITGEAPCAYHNAVEINKKPGPKAPLHHEYGGATVSQLENTIKTIKLASEIGKPVTVLTLNIGANDELHFIAAAEAIAKAEGEETVKNAVLAYYGANFALFNAQAEGFIYTTKIKPAVEAYYAANAVKLGEEGKAAGEAAVAAKVNAAVGAYYIANKEALEGEAAGECIAEEIYPETEAFVPCVEGKIAAKLAAFGAAYYAENEVKLGEEGKAAGEAAVNAKLAAYGASYVAANAAKLKAEGEGYVFVTKLKPYGEAYAAAHAAELAKAGKESVEKQIAAGVNGLFGQIVANMSGTLLAIRDAGTIGLGGIDYTGKIVVQGGYNPYGKLFNTALEAETFVLAHGGLTGPFERENTGQAVAPGFNALTGLLQVIEEGVVPKFGACISAPSLRFNPQTTAEPERLKKWTNMINTFQVAPGVYMGPDIHPTVAGYHELATEMKKACP